MIPNQSNENKKPVGRKQFVLWSIVLLAAASILSYFNPIRRKKSGTSRFLTEDGRLVEVDEKHVTARGRKLYLSDLKNWIKK